MSSTAQLEIGLDQTFELDMVIDIDPLVKQKPKASRRARQRDITPVKHLRKRRIYNTQKLVEVHSQQRSRTKARKTTSRSIRQAHVKALVMNRHYDYHVEASIMNNIFDVYDEASRMNQMFNQALLVIAKSV